MPILCYNNNGPPTALFRLTVIDAIHLATLDQCVRARVGQRACGSCRGADRRADLQGDVRPLPRREGARGRRSTLHPLTGDWSVARLAAVIDRTMPEDDPDKLDAAGSKRVAEFIYDAFYSPVAQAKLNPPRIELARLTVKQYRNAIADVIGSFRPPAKLDDKHGLRGEYFNARNFQNRAKLVDRVDREVNFDFGKSGPESKDGKAKFDPHQFCIRWEGSVLAPETGHYEFVVKTDHATRLWVNDPKKPLIDAWVKSGKDTEFRESIFLLAGRAYPLRLEFSKAKQGVDDSKKNPKPPAKPAFIALLWKRPHHADEVIASRFLLPSRSPEVAVIDTPFPPDDRSFGWERGTTISKEWDAATSDGAIEAAPLRRRLALPELAGVPDGSQGSRAEAARLRQEVRRAGLPPAADSRGAGALRRPPVRGHARSGPGRQARRAAGAQVAAVPLPGVSGGSRCNTPSPRDWPWCCGIRCPTTDLLDAAAAGQAQHPRGGREAGRADADDPRAKAKVREFLLTWLKVDQPKDLTKDAKRFPGFDPALAADLRTSLELFLDDVVWSEASDFRQLLLADEVYLNGRLAQFYGILPRRSPNRRRLAGCRRRPGPSPKCPSLGEVRVGPSGPAC